MKRVEAKPRFRQKAFTLLEVVLALGLMAVVAGVVGVTLARLAEAARVEALRARLLEVLPLVTTNLDERITVPEVFWVFHIGQEVAQAANEPVQSQILVTDGVPSGSGQVLFRVTAEAITQSDWANLPVAPVTSGQLYLLTLEGWSGSALSGSPRSPVVRFAHFKTQREASQP